MSNIRLFVICGFSCGLISAAASAQDAILIAEDGRSRAAIVVAADASEPERFAAGELAAFLHEISGAEFPVQQEVSADVSRLLVGPGAAKLADPAFSTDGLGSEGLVLHSVGRDLILAGGSPRGTIYAVYTFLEDELGCRWWTSKASSIPRRATLKIGPLNVRLVPPLEYRESFWFDALDGDWAVRNMCNGHFDHIEPTRGGRHEYLGFVHTFYGLIPPEKYFQEHPDWFSELNGQRTAAGGQLCLSNAAMRAELIKNLKERLRAAPGATIASVSQNDWQGACQCVECGRIDREEGSPSGSVLRFVNAVAAEIEPEFPQVAIDTLAYQYTRKPPLRTRPRGNVIVRLCSIECSFSRPLSDERNRAFRDDLLGWSKICERLYVWDYTTNFAHYIMPHPNLRVLAPNIRFFVEHGVKGVFEQGAYQSYGSEMAELRAWVLAKLLWNPSRDPQHLIDEFLNGYYGSAASCVRDYVRLMHDAVDASGDYLDCYSRPDAKFLSLGTLCESLRHLRAAEAAAGADAATLQRVRTAELPLLYVFLVRWSELRKQAAETNTPWPVADDIQAVYEEFMRVAQAENVTRVAEGRAIDWLRQVVDAVAGQQEAP